MWKFKETPETARFGEERDRMVRSQLQARGIDAANVLDVFRGVPRHLFVPLQSLAGAYEDHPLQIGDGQTISQPYMVAAMTQMLALKPSDRVLEIGTGSGYQTAILAELANDVYSIERKPGLAAAAEARLRGMGYENITMITGDGTLGYPDAAPYDAILVTAGSPQVPLPLKNQLEVGGRLVCPVGPRNLQTLVKIVRTTRGFDEISSIGCVFVPLIGQEGWEDPGGSFPPFP